MSEQTTTAYPFTAADSGADCVLLFGDAPGVVHPGCPYRATVHPELDCFHCSHCMAGGRISGAWFMDLLMQHVGVCATCGGVCNDEDCDCLDDCHVAQALADSVPYLPPTDTATS